MRVFLFLLLCVIVILVPRYSVLAGNKNSSGKALLLNAFGTSHPQARVAIECSYETARKTFPGIEVRLAFSSREIRRILTQKYHERIDSPIMALTRLADDGYREVAVQPLHVLPGIEFHELVHTVAGFRSMRDNHDQPVFSHLTIGKPLLTSEKDFRLVAQSLRKDIAAYAGNKESALVLMGHGSHHASNAAYSMLNAILQDEYGKNVCVGTIGKYPTISDLMPTLKQAGTRKITLMPFMLVAGDHARNDMAGDGEDSWKSILVQHGFEVHSVIKGLGENEGIISIYIEHARHAFNAMGQKECTWK